MIFGKNKYVIIELDSERLKMIHFSSGGKKRKILHLAVKDIIDFSEKQIAGCIVELLAEWEAKMDKVYVSISRQQITTRNLKLPSSNNKEITEMVDLQLSKLTPYSREEIVTNIQIIKVENGYSKILLLIIHRDIINRLLKIMDFGAIRPEEFYLSSEGVSLNYDGKISGNDGGKVPIGIIDIDYKWSDFVVIKESKLLLVRSINIGRTNLDQVEGDYKNKFVEEIKRLFEVYGSSDIDGEIKKIVLCGASADLTDIADLIKQNFNLDVEIGAVSEPSLQSQKSVSFSSLMGLGARVGLKPAPAINLTPAELTMERRLISRGEEIMLTGAMLFFIVILGMSVFFEKLYFRKENLQVLLEQYKSREVEVSIIEKKSAKINLIKEKIDSKLSVLNIISEIYKRTPGDLYFSAINFDRRRGIVLRGYSEDPSNIFEFVNQMEASPYFNQVKTTYMTKRKVADISLTDFELVSWLEGY
ncbi:MAG: PilN domain-containing protein [bacterium]